MISDLQRLSDIVAGVKSDASSKLSGLSETQWNWKPDKKKWSITQIVDHLNIVAVLAMPRFQTAVEELRTKQLRSDGPFKYGLIEGMYIRMVSPNPPFKVPVPGVFLPSTAKSSASILAEFLSVQDSLLALFASANGYDLKAVKVTSPASSLVKFSLGAWLEGIVGHEQYHWLQIVEILARPDFPID